MLIMADIYLSSSRSYLCFMKTDQKNYEVRTSDRAGIIPFSFLSVFLVKSVSSVCM